VSYKHLGAWVQFPVGVLPKERSAMSSNGNVRVKTLDKKAPKLSTSFLFVGALAFIFVMVVLFWGALVMLVTEYLEKMGLVEASLDYSESLGFGMLILAAISVTSAVWNGAIKQ
jgi:hypothetical protein